VPAEYRFGADTIVPLRAGETVRWKLATAAVPASAPEAGSRRPG
jgi:hypothetical protein